MVIIVDVVLLVPVVVMAVVIIEIKVAMTGTTAVLLLEVTTDEKPRIRKIINLFYYFSKRSFSIFFILFLDFL